MSKPIAQAYTRDIKVCSDGPYDVLDRGRKKSPLADLVSTHLRANSMRQIDFCRQTGFDQGLLSKILSSVVSTLNVETALKLADGLNIPPRIVFEAIGKKEVDEMLRRFYSGSEQASKLA